MEQIKAINPEQATGKSKELLDGVQKKLGMTPNMMRTMAQSPAVLEGYLNFSGALGAGSLTAKLREQIALIVAETNGCEYCLSAHSAVGRILGLSQEEISDSRRGESSEGKTGAALRLAHELVTERGRVSEKELAQVRRAGFSEGEITEIIANVALNLFTNYFNHVAAPSIDFPSVPPLVSQQVRQSA
jgi:uncharacterized peroxidase-related enzyme